jgi:hypothetical protein
MFPIVALALPALVTATKPVTTNWPAFVDVLLAVIVHVTVLLEVFTAPVLASVQAVLLVWVIAAFDVLSETLAAPPVRLCSARGAADRRAPGAVESAQPADSIASARIAKSRRVRAHTGLTSDGETTRDMGGLQEVGFGSDRHRRRPSAPLKPTFLYAEFHARSSHAAASTRNLARDYLVVVDNASARVIRERISRAEVRELAQQRFGDMVKASVDIRRGVIAIGGELHADEESLLLEDGSVQADVWGINIYPEESGDDWIEFDSMINVRPSQGNRSRGVDDPAIRERVRRVVERLIER